MLFSLILSVSLVAFSVLHDNTITDFLTLQNVQNKCLSIFFTVYTYCIKHSVMSFQESSQKIQKCDDLGL